MATPCEFDRLFTQTVPHIIEKIFLSLDIKSFMNCLEVSKSWNDLLTSESIQRMGKSIFCEDIHEELQQVAREGNTDKVRRIFSSGMVDMRYMTERYGTPLLLAAKNGHKDVVKLLLDKGVEPDQICWNNGKSEWTPLQMAAKYGHKDVVQILLDRGAEPNMAEFTPLLFNIIHNGYKDVLQLLLDRGANPNMADRNGSSPLYYAAYKGHKAVVQLLLDRRADPNLANRFGITPLSWAACRGYKDVVQLLLDRGAEPNMVDHIGMTPLSLAQQKGHVDIANIIQMLTTNGET